MENNGFYKSEYFEQLNKRLDKVENKIDILIVKVNWIYAFSGGIAFVASMITNFVIK